MTKHQLIKISLVPTLIAVFAFLIVRNAFAQLVSGDTPFIQSLVDADVEVGVESVDGYSQVYFVKNGDKKFITSGSKNSRMPVSSGQYIAYVTNINGAGQIFLYDLVSESTIQITNSRTNLKPTVSSDGKVAWERWVDETWQVALFDGIGTRRVTTGDLSMNADIEGNYVVFSRKGEDGVWRAVGYSIADDSATTVNVGLESKFPKLRDGQVVLDKLGGGEQVEPLKIEDMFLLDNSVATPSPLPTGAELDTKVTPEDVLQELNAQPIEEEEAGE